MYGQSALASGTITRDKKRYKVKVLDDAAFNALPFKHVGESLGCADKSTGTAYVRRTHWGEASKTIDALTLEHELQELIAKNSGHEDEDGIRYKKVYKEIIRPIHHMTAKAVLTSVGFAFGGPTGAAAGAALAEGMNQAELSVAGEGERGAGRKVAGAAAGGLVGGALGGPGSVIGAGAGGATEAATVSALSGGSAGDVGKSAAIGGVTGAGTALAVNTLSGALSSLFGGGAGTGTGFSSSAPITAGGTGTPSSAPIGASSAPIGAGGATVGTGGTSSFAGINSILASGKNILNLGVSAVKKVGAAVGKTSLGKLINPVTMLGLGAMALSARPTTAEMPNIGEITSKWLTPDTLIKSNALTESGAMAKGVLEDKYAGDFAPSSETTNLIGTIHKDIDKQYKQRIIDMDRMGALNNPQWAQSGERLEVIRRMMADQESEKSKVETELLSNAQQEHAIRRYEYVMEEWRVDEQVKREFLYADLADVMGKYDAKQEDIMNFREIAAKAGMYAFKEGIGD